MKFSKRLLLLLVCFAVLSSVFSLVASASSDIIQIYSCLKCGDELLTDGYIYPDDNYRQTFSDNITFDTSFSFFRYDMYIEKKDKTTLINEGSSFVATLQNVYLDGVFVLPTADGYPFLVREVTARVVFHDYNFISLPCEFSRNSDGYYYIKISCPGDYTLEKDVISIHLTFDFYSIAELSDFTVSTSNGFVFDYSFGEPTYEKESNQSIKFNALSLDIKEEELGFIASISKKISDVFLETKSMPKAIWTVFSDGITSLFVPDSASLDEIHSAFDALSREKFGAFYEVAEISRNMFNDISTYDEVNFVTVPEVTVEFSGTPFTFGGWDVKLIPDGFDFLVDVLKTIVAVICTLAFLNGLLHRYDEIMGVEQ